MSFRPIIAAAFLIQAQIVTGHHQPGVTIEMLTEQIKRQPALAELYFQRADEYLAVQKQAEAEADLNKALELKPDYLPAQRILCRLWQMRGQPAKALEILRASLTKVPAEHQFLLPGCRQLEGELLMDLGKTTEALTVFEAAIALTPTPDLDLLLFRAEAQRLLGKVQERIDGLKSAWERSHAIIMRNEWLNALIDSGRGAEALPFVQTELENSRFRSSWLIKRARIWLGADKREAAQEDLSAAIEELNTRLASSPPPYLLLCDRALAYSLLGKSTEARADVAQARQLGASEVQLRLILRLLHPPPADSK